MITDATPLFYDADVDSMMRFAGIAITVSATSWIGCSLSQHLVGRLQQRWLQEDRQACLPSTTAPRPWHAVLHVMIAFFLPGFACYLGIPFLSVLVLAVVGEVLIVLARIDAYTGLLPDVLTQPLLWAGLLFHLTGRVIPLEQAVLGAISGYLPLRLLAGFCQYLTGRPSMGHGDFKLAAALGAWVGASMIPVVLLVASCIACIAVGLRWLKTRQGYAVAIPFGPFLSMAGILGLFACFWPQN